MRERERERERGGGRKNDKNSRAVRGVRTALISTVRVISISSPLQFKGYRQPLDAFIPAKKFTPMRSVQLSTYGQYTCATGNTCIYLPAVITG